MTVFLCSDAGGPRPSSATLQRHRARRRRSVACGAILVAVAWMAYCSDWTYAFFTGACSILGLQSRCSSRHFENAEGVASRCGKVVRRQSIRGTDSYAGSPFAAHLDAALVNVSSTDFRNVRHVLKPSWVLQQGGNVTAVLAAGIDAMSNGDLREAEMWLWRATREDPGSAAAWGRLATVQYELDDYVSSLASIRRALAIDPSLPGARAGLGRVLIKLNRFSDAAEALRADEELRPRKHDGEVPMSWYASSLGALSGVMTHVSALAPHVGAWTITLCVLASVWWGGVQSGVDAKDNYAGFAKSDWSTFTTKQVEELRAGPDANGVSSLLRVTVVERTTKLGAPIQELVQLVDNIRSNSARNEVSARLLDELGVEEQSQTRAAAIADLCWKAWIFHENPAISSLMEEGIDCMAQGDLEGAKWRFTNAAHFDPSYAEAWNKLATVYYLMDQQELSLVTIEKTLEVEPRHFGALSGRGLVLLRLEQYGEAANAFREVKGPYPAAASVDEDVAFAEALQADQR